MWGLKQAQKMSKCVQVEWEDGLMASFNYLWLRDNSLKRPSLVHLDLNAKPEAVNCSRNALNLVWPPFSATNYSSDFLRENVQSSTHPLKVISNSISFHAYSKLPLVTLQSSESVPESAPLNGQTCSVVQASPIDAKHVVGQFYWRGTAQESGTIWPHMQKLPAVCAVESLNGRSAQLFVVDTTQALALLFKRHPAQFEFLAQCMLEYSEDCFDRNILFVKSKMEKLSQEFSIT
uniref:Uncharacterized protein n=1 Tax=Ditylenchus dipsaci TaxID=166011 RepID=A0A915DFS0_9BILA